MRNVWTVPVLAALMAAAGGCHWWPPHGGHDDDGDDNCRRGHHCVPDDDTTFCGGIAGIPCPGAGSCVDDPSDDCDPQNGGADCGGICECSAAAVTCLTGTVFDDDPDVCACLPSDEDAGVACGPATCAAGLVCCNESCGICTEPDGVCTDQFCEDPSAPFCGGIAAIPCPGEGECTDDPKDGCDPDNGGADCGGLCQCNVGPLIDCAPGYTFDDSPFVCACVPAATGG